MKFIQLLNKFIVGNFLIILLITSLIIPTPLCSEFHGHRSSTPVKCDFNNPLINVAVSFQRLEGDVFRQMSFPVLALLTTAILNLIPSLPIATVTILIYKFLQKRFPSVPNKYFYLTWLFTSLIFYLIYYYWSFTHPMILME